MSVQDRVMGSVVGLALGDALGAPFEFMRARDIPNPLPSHTTTASEGLQQRPSLQQPELGRGLRRSRAPRFSIRSAGPSRSGGSSRSRAYKSRSR